VYNLLEKNIDVHEYNSTHYLQDHSSGSDGSQVGSGNQIPYELQTENKEPLILEINDCDRSIQKGKCERYMYMKPVNEHVDQPTSYPVSIAVPKHLDSDSTQQSNE
jgi:hypothetical protein